MYLAAEELAKEEAILKYIGSLVYLYKACYEFVVEIASSPIMRDAHTWIPYPYPYSTEFLPRPYLDARY